MISKIKPGVLLYGIRPEMVLIDQVVNSIIRATGYDCIITAGTDKNHGKYSLHPVGFALDYRSKHIKEPMRSVMISRTTQELRKALPQCDIIHEHFGELNEHWHVEFDPKDDERFQKAKAEYRKTGSWPV